MKPPRSPFRFPTVPNVHTATLKQRRRGSLGVLLCILGVWGIVGCATTAGGQAQVDAEFRRCLDQQAYGSATSCWLAFQERFSDVASEGQLKFARDSVDSTEAVATQAAPLTQAPGSAESAGEFPPVKVGYTECYGGFRASGKPVEDLRTIASMCGEPAGMRAVSDIQSGSQAFEDDPDVFPLPLRRDRCYRFFAAGGQGIVNLDAALINPAGQVLARDAFTDAVPVLGPFAPYCPEADGPHGLVISVEAGGGDYAFQVFEGDRAAVEAQLAKTAPFPQDCIQAEADPDFGLVQVGMRVVLDRHRSVGAEDNWVPTMDRFVGRPADIVQLAGTDGVGCPVVRVSIDEGKHFWRIRDLRPLGAAAGPAPNLPSPPRAPVPGNQLRQANHDAAPASAAQQVVSQIESFASPGTDSWDRAVKGSVVGAFDGDQSGAIDTVPELFSVPCVVWKTAEARVRERDPRTSLLQTYGFVANTQFLGQVLGVSSGLRDLARSRLKACGLPE